jgi:hypothetical protein
MSDWKVEIFKEDSAPYSPVIFKCGMGNGRGGDEGL